MIAFLFGVFGALLIFPFPVIGFGIICLGVWISTWSEGWSDMPEVVMFYGAIFGIIAVIV